MLSTCTASQAARDPAVRRPVLHHKGDMREHTVVTTRELNKATQRGHALLLAARSRRRTLNCGVSVKAR
ncbi:hypothetical protein LMH87_012183 [Akanthomyces muscarius]|uniref:Uncharacterized protein n=1 Tax=Akanthomyces muscarius TaxID=2231603 RepID=A0A9W8ULX1_AKAMU|nr:hypothetical protein LMH87_012183 [Akanthomyces muscarius]KAJ4151490.1 hypothetical protein LMH87_012183 [Akanthomyces muscarius]